MKVHLAYGVVIGWLTGRLRLAHWDRDIARQGQIRITREAVAELAKLRAARDMADAGIRALEGALRDLAPVDKADRLLHLVYDRERARDIAVGAVHELLIVEDRAMPRRTV